MAKERKGNQVIDCAPSVGRFGVLQNVKLDHQRLTIVCRFKPIEKWPLKPTPEYMRQYSRFKAGWQATLDLLERELKIIDERP